VSGGDQNHLNEYLCSRLPVCPIRSRVEQLNIRGISAVGAGYARDATYQNFFGQN